MAGRDTALTTPGAGRPEKLRRGSRKVALVLGILLALVGLLVNPWSIQDILIEDGRARTNIINYVPYVIAVLALQSSLLLPGLWLAIKRPRLSLPVGAFSFSTLILVIGVGVGGYGSLGAWYPNRPDERVMAALREVNASEELIISLTARIPALGTSLSNAKFPGPESYELFGDTVEFIDLAEGPRPPTSTKFSSGVSVGSQEWDIEQQMRSAPPSELNLWRPLLDRVDRFEHATFKIERGRFLNGGYVEYETEMSINGAARMKSGRLSAIAGRQTLRWEEDSKTGQWRITQWRTNSLKTLEMNEPPFVEVLDQAIADPADLQRARASIHEDMVSRLLRSQTDFSNFDLPHDHFFIPAMDSHPGISVVDLDRDRHDDLYVMERWGENLFLRNRGDGTFEEMGAELGLNIKDHTSSAIFADFDNDGDLDVFLGRTLARSAYLVNENGRFIDRSNDLVDGPLPYLASSISAADYNGDGLLDIYISTYGASKLERETVFRKPFQFLESLRGSLPIVHYLSKQDQEGLRRVMRSEEHNLQLARAGPPNVLLKNSGSGRFQIDRSDGAAALRVFRNTFQSTWGDFDGDGDPDVFLSNDFGPHNLVRNDGGGKFTDVTAETGTVDNGFGMGASWGDYDNDGKLDLYSTNLHSTAGDRVLTHYSKLGVQLDPRLFKMNQGNSLFRNLSGRFENVAGLAPPALPVGDGGWGWAGQFVDVDNDGYLDIYSVAGYYTAPKSQAKPVDLINDGWREAIRFDYKLGLTRGDVWVKNRHVRDLINGASFAGNERDHLFLNVRGREFYEISGVSGLDHPGDGRAFATLDYDRDGWQDVALVSANAPMLQLYHNQIGELAAGGGKKPIFALRFVGGNSASTPSADWSNRDGYGAMVTVETQGLTVLREHRAGEGLAAQNSATMLVGVGEQTEADSITVRWPSGKVQGIHHIPTGTLATVYENPSQSPNGEAFVLQPY